MDVKLSSTDTTNRKDGRTDDELKPQDSSVICDVSMAGQADSMTEVTRFSEQTSTEDTQASSCDLFENEFQNKTVSGAASLKHSCCVEEEQPKPLSVQLSATVHAGECSHTFTTIRSQESLKTRTIHSEPEGDDLCAAFLLACLFCHPLDCFLAMLRGCNQCFWLLCSFLCGCEPTSLQPLLDVTSAGEACGCLGVRCCLCDCPVCDICLQATECLDLAMEISQMLYH